ncbi:MAG: hypothetical protein Q4F84_09840 [Fibrobacter sp.]|nr:hypothetical protein [Fibrobacter sp.]
MSLATILIKITGVVLLGWTAFSIYKHIKGKYIEAKTKKPDEVQSATEQFLNNIVLYLWLAFMLAFSTGMIFNN